MTTVIEGTFKHGNATFYSKTWKPPGRIEARLVFVHGFSEHINRYNDFFPQLCAHGIEVLAWDQRGWGRSAVKPAERGLTGPTAQVIDDVAAFVREALTSTGEAGAAVPVFVMGHSMGGGEILTLAGDERYGELVARVRGWIVECPLVGFPPGEEPNKLKVWAGRLVSRFLPRQQLEHVVPPEYLSRDPAEVEAVREDVLCHNTGTLEGLAGLLDRTAMLSSGQVRLGERVRSVLLSHGTSDRVCSYEAAKAFLEAQTGVRDKTVRAYQDGYHQLHTDHCKEEFAHDLVAWILERCDGREGGGSKASVEAKL